VAESEALISENGFGNNATRLRMADHQTSYDAVPYKSYPFPQTHPDRMATLGRLFGFAPPPVACCRVLELGCASGGNLIPLAFQLPDSEFVGVDRSGWQVGSEREVIQALGLNNLRIEHTSILDIDVSWGEFD
jgi:tRNA G46 methylase TrmB